jgi:hypothetical protein
VRPVQGQQPGHHRRRSQPCSQGAPTGIWHRHLRCCHSHAGPAGWLACQLGQPAM